jgi:hypothetical protein
MSTGLGGGEGEEGRGGEEEGREKGGVWKGREEGEEENGREGGRGKKRMEGEMEGEMEVKLGCTVNWFEPSLAFDCLGSHPWQSLRQVPLLLQDVLHRLRT